MNRLWQNVQSTRFVVLFILAFFIFSGNSIAQGADGKALFRANCASCHKASEENSTGPGLQGVLGRIPGGNWKYDWVHNSSKVIASGDPYATTLYAKYKTQMTPFPNLTNEQIDAILAYANKGEVKPAVNASGEDIGAGNAGQKGKDAAIPWFMITIIVIVLIAFIAILRYTRINLSNVVREREGLPEQPALPFFEASRVWVNNNKKIVAAIGVFLICVLVVKGWYGLKGVGVYAEEVHPDEWVGYHPSQPINFSHKIHAGDNGIQCQYCHATVEKSKTASIPSANVCMNCHKDISQNQAGTDESKAEIAKIYAAVGWNPDIRDYTLTPQPLKWNKVHNLPDHVFFSHQQHVVVGQVDCSVCHGDVKKMGTVEQQRPLTMGWCVNCHRETPVRMEGNGYYTELHEKMKEKYKDQPITVSMVGGIECSRCHY